MRKAPILILSWLVAGSASAQVIDTTRPVNLCAADRAAVEKAACAESGKPALSINGQRGFMWGNRELSASVLCEDAVENDAYRAYFYRGCTKHRGRWKCSPPAITLFTDVAGGGPHEIQVDDLTLDEALKGLKCLEAVYTQNPQILNGANRGNVGALYAGDTENGRPFVAYVEARNECFWLEYPRQCRADGKEPVPVKVRSGCIDE